MFNFIDLCQRFYNWNNYFNNPTNGWEIRAKVIVNLFSKYLAYYVFKIIRINDKQNDLSIVSMKILHVIVLFLTLPGEQHSELI